MGNRRTDVIILRGAPGAGKSQTAKSLAQFFPRGVRLEVDTIRQMVISVNWTNQEEHIAMLQVSAGLVCEFLKRGFSPVIVVDTFSGDKVDSFIEHIRAFDKNVCFGIFGLFTTDHELERRIEMRRKGEFKDVAICKKLNSDVLKIKHDAEWQIDTTGLQPSETACKIFQRLTAPEFAFR